MTISTIDVLCAEFDASTAAVRDHYWRAGPVPIRSGAVAGACAFTKAMLPALQRADEHPDMTEELADILSTRAVEVGY